MRLGMTTNLRDIYSYPATVGAMMSAVYPYVTHRPIYVTREYNRNRAKHAATNEI